MTTINKWIDNRLSEYLAIQGVELTPEQYEAAMSEIDLWLFENIDTIISQKVQEVL